MLLCYYSMYILMHLMSLTHTLNVNTIMEKLENSLQNLCPGVDICRNSSINASSLQTRNRGSGKTSSCCKACYCYDNCKKGTCCFNATANQVNTEGLLKSEVSTICRNPVTDDASLDKVDVPITQPYYMVISPPNNGCVNTVNRDIAKPCDDEQHYPWGSLFPVFSPKTNFVYANPKCAECHGLQKHEYESWQGLMVFQNMPTAEIWKSNVFWILDELIRTRKMSSEFLIQFFPKGHENLLESEKCYFQLETGCLETFQIPSDLNMTSIEIKEACYFGPRSPITTSKGLRAYYNIYCYICNGENPEFPKCFEDTLNARIASNRFSTLLDDNFFDLVTFPSIKDKQDSPTACKDNDENAFDRNGTRDAHESLHNDCRPVLCPTGQSRGEDGQCKHYGQKWLGSKYVVIYQLNTNRPVDVESLMSKATFDAFQKSRICQSKWQLGLLYRIPPTVEGKVDEDLIHELAALCQGDAGEQLSDVLKFVSENIKRPLILETATGTMVFTLALAKYGGFYLGTVSGVDFVIKVPENLHKKPDLRFKVISVHLLVTQESRTEIGITKMYLCEQVSLYPEEYLLVNDGFSAALIYNGRTYFAGEFFLTNEGTADTTVRICLDDSPFKRQEVRRNFALGKHTSEHTILLIALLVISTLNSV